MDIYPQKAVALMVAETRRLSDYARQNRHKYVSADEPKARYTLPVSSSRVYGSCPRPEDMGSVYRA